MLTLSIHTSGGACDVALIRDASLVGRKTEAMKRGHDQRLPVLTQELILTSGVRLSDVDQFAVNVGPGSFTGIRVGVAFARGLALANESSAIGITSLEAMFLPDHTGPQLALLPARQRLPDLSFWAQGIGIAGLEQPVELDVEHLERYVSASPICLVPETLPDAFDETLTRLPTVRQSSSDAVTSGQAAQRSGPAGDHPARPAYVREPDAIPAKPVRHVADH